MHSYFKWVIKINRGLNLRLKLKIFYRTWKSIKVMWGLFSRNQRLRGKKSTTRAWIILDKVGTITKRWLNLVLNYLKFFFKGILNQLYKNFDQENKKF